MAEQYSIVYMCHIFFRPSSVHGYFGYFCVLAIVNSAAVNSGVRESVRITVFCAYNPKYGIAGLCDRSLLSILKNLRTVLRSGCTNFHFTQHGRNVPFLPGPLQHLLYVDLLMMATLTGVRGSLVFVFISVALSVSNFEHLFLGFLFLNGLTAMYLLKWAS